MKRAIHIFVVLSLLMLAGCALPSISWTDASLVNSWSNQTPTYQAVQYGKDSWGQVHIRGTATHAYTTGTIGVFVLPADYCPSYPMVVSVGVQTAGGARSGFAWIYPNGMGSNQVQVGLDGSTTFNYVYFGEIVFNP
jgi:hypothetical protein